ncbi:site-specific integrase [Zhongshania sp. BJYM1]|uniref:site-specific integrase n=1 Tax=Zhongshania aquatica TaxID=2965069 RepID=UPI0022B51413|nr:site-specific integrase [Marortus sp. BJYM1]
MASIGVRSNRIYIDFRYKGVRCREQTKLNDTPANQKRAKQILERIEAEITLDTFDYARYFPKSKRVADFQDHARRIDQLKSYTPTFAEFSAVWFSETEVSWRNSHKDNVALTLRKYLCPAFGDMPLDQITKAQLLAFRANLTKIPRKNGNTGLSPARINKIMMPLRQILNEGAERYQYASPFRGIKTLKLQKSHIEPFSFEDVHRIIATVRADFKNYYTTRFFTGMRTGEIDGLMWKYVDFERREILIRETWVMGQMEYTKNDGSQREIQMSQPVYDALLAQRDATSEYAYVFCNRLGTPLSHNNITRRVWYPLLRYLGLNNRRPYQTRHTAATLWLAAGESPEWIARQMGHTTTEMLFKVYSRYVPNLTRADGSAFERLLTQQFPNNALNAETNNPLANISPSQGAEND